MTREEGDPCQKIEKIIEIAEQTGITPSFSIITGDISQNGSQGGYEIAKEYIRKIEKMGGPALPVIGNVDEREAFRRNLLKETCIDEAAPCCYARTVEGLQVIGLDSKSPMNQEGTLQGSQCDWLRSHLLVGEPTIIALHHPPLTLRFLGGALRSFLGTEDETKFAGIVTKSNTIAILCGHMHQSLMTQMNGVSVVVGPATLSEVLYSDNATKTYDASGFTIHTLKGDTLTSRPLIYSGGRRLIKTA